MLFVAPGIVFDLLSRSRRVGADESAFREVSRVALSSLLLSLFAAVPVGLVASRVPLVMPTSAGRQKSELGPSVDVWDVWGTFLGPIRGGGGCRR